MRTSKNKRRSKKKRQPSMRLTCNLDHGETGLRYRTPAMHPRLALQQMKDAVAEMRTIMAMGKRFTARPEPKWLTDAVTYARLSERKRYGIVDEE